MLALVLAMLFCVAIGAGVVGYVMLEARREGRGGFWTAEGEELIAGARRTSEKVRTRGEQLGRTAAGRTRDLAAKLPEVGSGHDADGENSVPGGTGASDESGHPQDGLERADSDTDGFRAAS